MRRVGVWVGWEDLAATDFPAPWGAVSWALVVFTSEFGMGSGVVPPPWPPGRLSQPRASLVWRGGQALVRAALRVRGVRGSVDRCCAWRAAVARVVPGGVAAVAMVG